MYIVALVCLFQSPNISDYLMCQIVCFPPDFHGVFLSNGPGDPILCSSTVEHIRRFMESGNGTMPLFGICLGHQLLARAIGVDTFKMK